MQQDKIQMVDLYSQYLRIKTYVDKAIESVILNSAFVKGEIVQKFEEDLANYLNVKHVISCANGTDALQIAMMSLGLKRGDEIMVPSFTYVATAEAIALLGLTPVLIDVNPNDFCIDIKQLEKQVTHRTKAIVPVHLFGQSANMEAILNFAKQNELFVIEDTAQALGSRFTFSDGSQKSVGCIGDIGTTSFFPSKNLGCFGDGGALMTNDDMLAEKIRMVANHGQKVQYYHDIVGVNSRLDGLQAAILIEKLKELDDYEKRRNTVAKFYDENIHNLLIIKPYRNENSTHVFHQYTIRVLNDKRDALRTYLRECNIPTMIYYPLPLHKQRAYSNYSNQVFSVSENLCKTVLSLPIHTEMPQGHLELIVNSINLFE